MRGRNDRMTRGKSCCGTGYCLVCGIYGLGIDVFDPRVLGVIGCKDPFRGIVVFVILLRLECARLN